MSFAANLDKLQKERGETNYRLAKEIGVHQSSVANWKAGISPHPKHLRLVAEHFGVPVEALVSSSNEETR